MSRSLKLAQTKVRNTLEFFNPSKYPPEVVNANKDVWIKKVEDAFDVVAELSLDLEEFVLPAELHEMFQTNEVLKDEIYNFVLSTNTMSIKYPHPVVTNFEDLESQPKLNRAQFPTFPVNNEKMNALRANQVEEEELVPCSAVTQIFGVRTKRMHS